MLTLDRPTQTIQGDLDYRAYQAFVLASKMYWTTELYRAVADEAVAVDGDGPGAIEETLVGGSPTYRLFGWLEHYLQQFKYYGRYGILVEAARIGEDLSAAMTAVREAATDRLQLDPTLELPTYYTSIDFHQHPGGVWSDDVDAFAYELGASSTTPTLTEHGDLHTRYARFVHDVCAPKSLLDLGCGFGKTTIPMKVENPEADVVGIDLSAPCLTLAHLRSTQAGVDIGYRQMAAEKLTGIAADSVDCVTGSMLIHEMPPPAIRSALKEAHRVLSPGGKLALLDFYVIPGGAPGAFFHLGHSARNEEPLMRSLIDLDLVAELRDVGFTEISLAPFEESAGALANGDALPASWRFPWTMICSTKEAATS